MDGLPTIEECQNRAVPSVSAPPAKPLPHTEVFNTDGKINTNTLKDHFFREGKLELEDVKHIIITATEILRKEPNLLKLQSPMTSKDTSN
jgi:serine/threonine-protein phosphatase 2B catalytic subunit